MSKGKTQRAAAENDAESTVIHLIARRAQEVGRLSDLTTVVTGWYKQHIDAHGFVAGGDIGPVEPEVPRAQE